MAKTAHQLARNYQAIEKLIPTQPPFRYRRLISAAFAFGCIFGFFAPYLTTESPWAMQSWSYPTYWDRVLGVLIAGGMSMFLWSVLITSIHLKRLTLNIENIDIFSKRGLEPLAAHGQLNALLCIGGSSIAGLFIVDPGQWSVVMILAGLLLLIGIVGFLLPGYSVYQKIIAIKEIELEAVEASIANISKLPSDSVSKMINRSELLTYRDQLNKISNWPSDLARGLPGIIYLCLPFISWLIAFYVENILLE